MGICSSCYRRRKRRIRDLNSTSNFGFDEDSERQPLLPGSTAANGKGKAAEATARERYYEYETRWANTTQALKKGKIPSQEQFERMLRAIGRLLDTVDEREKAVGKLSEEGRALVGALKDTTDALIVWGQEKNYDSKLQTIIHNTRILSQSQTPSQNDLISVLRLLVTSAAFRVLAMNILLLFTGKITSKALSVARNVEDIAQKTERAVDTANTVVHGVETVAAGVDQTLKAAIQVTSLAANEAPTEVPRDAVEDGMQKVSKGVGQLSHVATEKGKAKQAEGLDDEEKRKAMIEKLREILLAAHSNRPDDIQGLRTALLLSEQYLRDSSQRPTLPKEPPPSPLPMHIAPEAPPSLRLFSVPPPPASRTHDDLLQSTIADLKILLQRIAGGKTFDSVIESFKDVFQEEGVGGEAEAEQATETVPRGDLFNATLTVFRHAVDEPDYLSDEGNFTSDIADLIHRWEEIGEMSEQDRQQERGLPERIVPARERDRLRNFAVELSMFLSSVENDTATNRLIDSFGALEKDFAHYFSAPITDHIQVRVIIDMIGYILPRLVGKALSPSASTISSSSFALPLPLPRVEVKSPALETAVDMRGMLVNVDVSVERKRKWWKFWKNPSQEEEEEYWWGHQTSSRRNSRVLRHQSSWNDSTSSTPTAATMPDSAYSTLASTSEDLSTSALEESSDGPFTDLLTPKSVKVKRWDEVVIDFRRPAGTDVKAVNERTPLIQKDHTKKGNHVQRSTSTTSRSHISVDGLFVGLPLPSSSTSRHARSQLKRTISFENISYYVSYTFWWFLGYRDEGVVDLDIFFNSPSNESEQVGGTVEMDLEVDLNNSSSADKPLRIPQLSLTLPPTLDISMDLLSVRHVLLTSAVINPLVLPVATWFARREAERVAGETLRTVLEEGGNHLLEVWGIFADQDDDEGKNKGWFDVLLGTSHSSGSPEPEPSEPEDGPSTKTDVDVSLRGVNITVSQTSPTDQDGPSSTSPQLELAIGVAPQLLPEKAEPELPVSGTKLAESMVETVGNEVVEDAAMAAGTVRGILKGTNGGGTVKKQRQVRYQDDGGSTDASVAKRRHEEGREMWRSEAFDW